MRDARQISAREVSHGVQRHVLAWATWFGSTVMAQRGAAPPVFERLNARAWAPLVVPPGHGPDESTGPLPSTALTLHKPFAWSGPRAIASAM
jgi:hypothetical protein